MNKKAEKILSKTTDLFIKSGIKKITMDEIAKNSNVSKVTIYKYFTDKETLCMNISKYIFSHYKIELNNIVDLNIPISDKLYSCLGIVSEFVNSNKFALCDELSKYSDEVQVEYEMYLKIYKNTIMNLIESGKENMLIRKDVDSNMIFYYIDMGIVYYQQNSEYRNKMLNENDFKKNFLLFIINGIFVEGQKLLDER
ncbi:MAG: TetR/AcrR family transcriptional regulator [Clostridiales bacterium]